MLAPRVDQVARIELVAPNMPDGAVRTALITGGTSGLGLAMARALGEKGMRVALTGRSGDAAAEAAAGIPNAVGVAMDVTDEASVLRALEQVRSRVGELDMLVNNAGLGMRTVNPQFLTRPMGFWDVPVDGFRAVVDTNLAGYFIVARAVVPRMLARNRGRIVNISVSASTMTRAGTVPYGPSRAGSESLSRVMAADLAGTGVTANLLLPGGATATGMVPPGADTGGRVMLSPDVMGPPIVWLASAEAEQTHDERIIATEFENWLQEYRRSRPEWSG
jgi:NAD(P)-dependent dehydrogenase (short-subunit alcohol dehydrogenase family)